MNAADFVTRLKDLAPPKRAIKKHGFDDDEADEFIDSFIAVKREKPLGIQPLGDPMLSLIDEWDLSNIQIGPLSFVEPYQDQGALTIGVIELDRLAFRSQARDFVVFDRDNENRVAYQAASSGGPLLDALIVIAEYFVKTTIDEIDFNDEAVGRGVKASCIKAMGSPVFETFCTSLLGF